MIFEKIQDGGGQSLMWLHIQGLELIFYDLTKKSPF